MTKRLPFRYHVPFSHTRNMHALDLATCRPTICRVQNHNSQTSNSSSPSWPASSPPPSSLVTCGCAAARSAFFLLTSSGAGDRAMHSAAFSAVAYSCPGPRPCSHRAPGLGSPGLGSPGLGAPGWLWCTPWPKYRLPALACCVLGHLQKVAGAVPLKFI